MKFISRILFLSLTFFLFSINTQTLEPLTPTELLSMNKLSGYNLSPDGKYLIIGVKKWNPDTGKSYSHLQYKDLETNITKTLTPNIEGQSDTSPQFSNSFPGFLFFQRSNKDIKSSIYYIQFPPQEISENDEDKSVKLTDYILPISEYKLKSKTILFNTDVYFQCKTMNCTNELIEKESKQNYQIYTKLFVNHWDTWLVEGKGSHLFIQELEIENNKIILKNEVKDVTEGMEINTPPLFTDSSNYDLSNDGKKIAFSAHLRNNEEAWNTGFKTYYMDLVKMKKPVCITNHTSARTQNPVFSKDDTKIGYLAMKTPGLESEILHFEIYNILSNKLSVLPNDEELSIQAFYWNSDFEIVFYANTFQANKLFKVNVKNVTKPVVESIDVKYERVSYALPVVAMKNKNVVVTKIAGYDTPERLLLLKYNDLPYQIDIVDLNEDFLKTKFIATAEEFSFTGGYNEEVYGFFFKPINFDPQKTYPVAVLIHGGPESSYTHAWGTSWNPQMYTSRGYAVIMVNPHGSSGFGEKFQDDVRLHWGGVPFEDIIMGVNYILKNKSFLDKDRMCAAGASYGGFMINWIEGHNEKNETLQRDWTFNCLVNHDGVFNQISMFYSTEEIWFPKEEFCDKKKGNCNPWEGEEVRKNFEIYSPEKFVKNWNTPMIVVHGGTDYRVPLTEGLSTFTALQLRGVPSKFLFLHQENHWVLKAENQVKWFEEVYDFFDEYTKSNEFEESEDAKYYKVFNKKFDNVY